MSKDPPRATLRRIVAEFFDGIRPDLLDYAVDAMIAAHGPLRRGRKPDFKKLPSRLYGHLSRAADTGDARATELLLLLHYQGDPQGTTEALREPRERFMAATQIKAAEFLRRWAPHAPKHALDYGAHLMVTLLMATADNPGAPANDDGHYEVFRAHLDRARYAVPAAAELHAHLYGDSRQDPEGR